MTYKKVIGHSRYIDKHHKGTLGTNWLKLECGHEINQPGSVRIPKRKHCVECAFTAWRNRRGEK